MVVHQGVVYRVVELRRDLLLLLLGRQLQHLESEILIIETNQQRGAHSLEPPSLTLDNTF